MADAFTGEIRLFPFGYAPVDWHLCDGSLQPVQQYQALFTIIGITYGGNGQTTFGLPNLMGRAAVGYGVDAADNFAPAIGSTGGHASVAVDTTQVPPHNHVLNGAQSSPAARVDTATGNLLTGIAFKPTSGSPVAAFPYVAQGTPAVTLGAQTLSVFTGSGSNVGQAHENRQPYLTIGWYICMNGAYPARPS